MFGELIPCGGGEAIPLYEASVTVGRNPSNDVCIPLGFISGTHCRLEFRDGTWHVFDENSRNGVKINGEKRASGSLKSNDVLSLGSARYRLVYARPSDSSHSPSLSESLSGIAEHDSFWEEMMIAEGTKKAGGLSAVLSATKFGTLTPCGGGDPIALYKENLLVGRRAGCDIVLEFKSVSGKHFQLELRDGFWHVADLGSRNGIKIDGERCDEGWLLPGSILSVAKQRYEINYEAPEGAEPPVSNPFAKGLLEKAGLKGIPKIRVEEDDDDDRPSRYELT